VSNGSEALGSGVTTVVVSVFNPEAWPAALVAFVVGAAVNALPQAVWRRLWRRRGT
jgi:hypothetical protein